MPVPRSGLVTPQRSQLDQPRLVRRDLRQVRDGQITVADGRGVFVSNSGGRQFTSSDAPHDGFDMDGPCGDRLDGLFTMAASDGTWRSADGFTWRGVMGDEAGVLDPRARPRSVGVSPQHRGGARRHDPGRGKVNGRRARAASVSCRRSRRGRSRVEPGLASRGDRRAFGAFDLCAAPRGVFVARVAPEAPRAIVPGVGSPVGQPVGLDADAL